MVSLHVRVLGACMLLGLETYIWAIEFYTFVSRHMQRFIQRLANQDPAARVLLSMWGGSPNILRLFQQFGAPAVMFPFAIAFAVLSFSPFYRQEISIVLPHPSAANTSSQSPLVATVDADIAGIGIRLALWAQIAALVLLTVVGSFYCRALGAKEIGAGLAVTHTSLAVALVVQLKYGTLTSADAIVGAMLLDAQGSAMSIVLVVKDVLAARWQTWISIVCQTFGLTVLLICVIRFAAGDFVGRSDDTWYCIKTFWWGWVTDCQETAEDDEATVFWLYLACRIVGSFHATFFAATNTGQFHSAEKSGEPLRGILFSRTPASVADESRVPGSQTPSSARPDDGGESRIEDPHPVLYTNCRATVTLSYVMHTVLSVMSMVALQRAMDIGMEASSGALSVGQIISMVVALATAVRALWLVSRAIYAEHKGFDCLLVVPCGLWRAFLTQVYQADVREDREVELDAREQV